MKKRELVFDLLLKKTRRGIFAFLVYKKKGINDLANFESTIGPAIRK